MQVVIAYLLVAGAAGWIAWSMFVPGKLKARLRGRVGRRR